MSYIDVTGKTEEEAISKALAQLGMDRDDVSVEILERAKSGFLGMGAKPARVRVTYGPDEAPMEEVAVPVKPVVEKVEKKEEPKPRPQKPQQSKPQQPRPTKPRREEKPAEAAAEAPAAPAVELPECHDDNAQRITVFLTGLLEHMESPAAVKVYEEEKGRYKAILEGQKLGALIGRRGETMESLSYLASLVVNRMEGPYIKLGLDVGGYRNKREDDLSALARRIADRVIRTGCYYEMEPMNPYERHIIHTAIAEIDGVRSESKGEGPARHVVLYSTDPNASNLPDRDNARNQRGGRRDGGRDPRRDGNRGYRGNGPRGPRSGRDGRDGGRGGYRGNRGDRGPRYGGPRSSVPAREFADAPRDPAAKPMAPKTTERIHDGDDFAFGKIEF